MSGGNQWRFYVFIHEFYQFQAVNLAKPKLGIVAWNVVSLTVVNLV